MLGFGSNPVAADDTSPAATPQSLPSASAPGPAASSKYVRPISGWFWRSFAVFLEVILAFLIREAIAHRHPGFAPFITFYPAVLFAALLDGFWAGLAATIFSLVLADYWIFAPRASFVVRDPYDMVSLGLFFIFGLLLSTVVELYHRNRQKLAAYQVEEAIRTERRTLEEERKLAELVQAERKRLFDVFETLPAMISLRRADHLIAFANRSFREKFGEPAGRRCFEARFGRAEPCADCETFLPLQTGQPHHREVTFPDQSLIEAYDFPFKDLDGTAHILEMGIDITDRRRAEIELERHRAHLEELVAERTRQLELANARLAAEIRQLEQAQQRIQENRAKLEAALSAMTDSVIITDAHGRFVQFNEACATFYRFKNQSDCVKDFAAFATLFEISTPAGEPVAKEMYPMWRALRGESASNIEYSYRRRDTGETWMGSLAFSPVRAEDGTISGAVITSRDITERKRTEEALRRGEKIALQREQFQALAKQLRRAREEERTKVARDLHDQIGQILTAIKLDLKWMARRLPEVSDEVRSRLDGAIGLTNDGVRSVRKICSGLRPGVLDDLGLAAAIEWQANEFASRTGIPCAVSVPSTDLTLSGDQATELFRIFQECLTNVMRHAQAHRVVVSLDEEGGDLVLAVADDGKGFRESDASMSLGFLGMKERAQVCGGTIHISSFPGGGTTVTLRVPVNTPYYHKDSHAHSDRR